MITYQQQRQQVIQLFQSAAAMAQRFKHRELEKRLNESEKHFAQGKLVVVVCGEFKQGKSSLINALLGEPDLFPVDIDVTTSLVSSITYGPTENITVMIGEPGKERERQIQRSEIPDYVTEQRNPQNAWLARMLIIEAPNEQLKDGLTLVDTPGVGGLNKRHSDVTYAFLQNADVVLFVSDALRPLSTHDLQFITEQVAPHCQNIIFVVTKIDVKRDFQAVVEENRQKLAQALGGSGDTIFIIPVSSRSKLAYLQSQDSEDLEDSNFMALENEIWKLLREQRARILLAEALSTLGEAITEMERPLRGEFETYQQQNAQQVQVIESQFREAEQRLKTLLDNDALWRVRLSDGMSDIRTDLTKQFQEGFVLIRRQLDRYLDDDTLRERPDQLMNQLQTDINGLMSIIAKNLGQLAGKLYADLNSDIEASSGLHLNSLALVPTFSDRAISLPSWNMPDQSQQAPTWYQTGGAWDKVVFIANSAKSGGTGGGIAGGTAGVVLGGIIGFLLGSVAALPGAVIGGVIGRGLGQLGGLITGFRGEMAQQRGKRKAEIARLVTPFLEDCQRECTFILNEALKTTERTVRDELRSQIQREKQSYEQTLQSIQDARKLTRAEADGKMAELKGPLDTLQSMRKRVEDLARLALEPAPGASRRPVAAGTELPQRSHAQPAEMLPGADSGSFADE